MVRFKKLFNQIMYYLYYNHCIEKRNDFYKKKIVLNNKQIF